MGIFGPRRYEVTRSLRKLHNEELAKYKEDKIGRVLARTGLACMLLVGKAERKRPLGRPRRS
jgi:hypothetical protein